MLEIPTLQRLADGTPFSGRYGDVYYAAAGGPAQAWHVFLAGNDLPARWQGRGRFVILETGFGLGLNFLATWQAWRADPQACRELCFISLEKHPFAAADLAAAQAAWPEFASLAGTLQAQWPPLQPGEHRVALEGLPAAQEEREAAGDGGKRGCTEMRGRAQMRGMSENAGEQVAHRTMRGRAQMRGMSEVSEVREALPPPEGHAAQNMPAMRRVELRLLFGDAAALLPALTLAPDEAVDAFFLDGFSPARNPDLWSPALCRALARLAKPGATLATWSVAGSVRRALSEAGFMVEKRPGFADKRQMLVGRFP